MAEDDLPKGWDRVLSKTHKRYYYANYSLRKTQWQKPESSTTSHEGEPFSKRKKTVSSSVAIIVPFRDLHKEQKRSLHLKEFIPHMMKFLSLYKNSQITTDYHVYIIEQSDDDRKFNRGKLLNIGFDIASKDGHNIFIFHDVDLLPSPELVSWYFRHPKRPIHIARVWDRYSNNEKYFGGIVSFSKEDMEKINGFPNTFWGWGGEDDEMQKRCEINNIQWTSPLAESNGRQSVGTIRDLEDMDLHTKLNFLKQHKKWKCMVKWEALKEHEQTWKTNGLRDLDYKILKRSPSLFHFDKASKITVDVKLNKGHWANDKCGVDYMPEW